MVRFSHYALLLVLFLVAQPAVSSDGNVEEQEGEVGADLDDGSLFGADVPPFALGWSHAPIVGVVKFGRPFGVSASYAGVFGTESMCGKPVNWGGKCAGLMAGAEFGLGGARAGIGAGTVTAGRGHFGVMISGMRTWAKPAFFEAFPIQNYGGVELITGIDSYHFSLGAYFPVKKGALSTSNTPSISWSVGAGF